MKRVGELLGPTDLAGPEAVPPRWRATPYKAVRRVWCGTCLRRYRVRVSKAFRLRSQRSPCCGARLHAVRNGSQALMWANGEAPHPERRGWSYITDETKEPAADLE